MSADQVRGLVKTPLDNGALESWITVASAVVDSKASCIGSDEGKLENIELFLSAHFVSMLSPSGRGVVVGEDLEEFKTRYSNPAVLQEQINSTPYGAAANMASGGCLSGSADRVADAVFLVSV